MPAVELSVVIATYNSEKTLSMVIGALEKQSFSRKKYEVLVIDGGSLDSTIRLAKKHKCKVIPNPRTEPVFAKFLGFKAAKGKFIMYLDHDEVLLNPKSIEKRMSLLSADKNIVAALNSGYQSPAGFSLINDYSIEFGDPFSCFIYRLSKRSGIFLKTMLERYPSENAGQEIVTFDFAAMRKNPPIMELVAMGSIFSLAEARKAFGPQAENPPSLPHVFYYLSKADKKIAIMREDPILHYSADSLGKFLSKIKWRIKNNIKFRKRLGDAGFAGREQFGGQFFAYKKYLFLPYSLLLFPVIIDSIYLAGSRRNARYLLHFPLCLYTVWLISYYSASKFMGLKIELKSYDESKRIQV